MPISRLWAPPLAPPAGLKNQEDEKNADAFFDSGAQVMRLYYP
ncbi:hypothetical protein [Methanoregula formicica]|nr:hypothetical protein [Methanoregula formicica]